MNTLNIDNIEIKLDNEGRYCLNDQHKAAGGDKNHQPFNFFRQESTDGLINELLQSSELRTEPLKVIRGGKAPGTFVCRELVYAYAMWISPSFNLKVIRAFDRLNTRGVAVADHAAADLRKNPLKYMRELLEQAEVLEAELAIAKPHSCLRTFTQAKLHAAARRFVSG